MGNKKYEWQKYQKYENVVWHDEKYAEELMDVVRNELEIFVAKYTSYIKSAILAQRTSLVHIPPAMTSNVYLDLDALLHSRLKDQIFVTTSKNRFGQDIPYVMVLSKTTSEEQEKYIIKTGVINLVRGQKSNKLLPKFVRVPDFEFDPNEKSPGAAIWKHIKRTL